MLIIGAGIAGLIAAHALRCYKPVVWEAQSSLPDNHSALLRFRTDVIGRITGVPLQRVRVLKAVMAPSGALSNTGTLLHANAYARKVTGIVAPRSILDLAPVTRYVAGPEFLQRMAVDVDIHYNAHFGDAPGPAPPTPIVSTIPLPVWLRRMQLADSICQAHDITTIAWQLAGVDIYQTVYYPWPFAPTQALSRLYRASYHGDRLIMELTGNDPVSTEECEYLFDWFTERTLGGEIDPGLPPVVRVQPRGKLVPLPAQLRRKLVSEITERFGVYSLGRYATWRQVLLDDLPGDIEVIGKLIEQGSYARKLQYATE